MQTTVWSLTVLVVLWSSTALSKDCGSNVLFVIDSTGSVKNDFSKLLDYATEVIGGLSEAQQVAALLYCSKLRQFVRFKFGEIQGKKKLISEVKAFPYLGGITYTGEALKTASKLLTEERNGNDVSVVVITDGFSYDLVKDTEICQQIACMFASNQLGLVAEPAEQLRSMGDVEVYAVAVTDHVNRNGLLAIAGSEDNLLLGMDTASTLTKRIGSCGPTATTTERPATTTTKKATTTPTTKRTTKAATKKRTTTTKRTTTPMTEQTEKASTPKRMTTTQRTTTQREPEPTTTTKGQTTTREPTTTSSAPTTTTRRLANKCLLDIAIVLDASGSLEERFSRQLMITVEVVDRLRVGEDAARVGLIRFASRLRTSTLFNLNTHYNKTKIEDLIRSTRFLGGTTALDAALEMAVEQFSSADKGARPATALPIAIVFSDGYSQKDPRPAAKALRDRGVTIFCIAIDEPNIRDVSFAELTAVAGDASRVFTDDTIAAFNTQLNELTQSCQ